MSGHFHVHTSTIAHSRCSGEYALTLDGHGGGIETTLIHKMVTVEAKIGAFTRGAPEKFSVNSAQTRCNGIELINKYMKFI